MARTLFVLCCVGAAAAAAAHLAERALAGARPGPQVGARPGPLRLLLRERALAAERAAAAARFAAPPPDQFYEQPLDHLTLDASAASDDLWRQRFWTNSTMWEQGGRVGPIFLYVEGEGSGSAFNVLEGQHVELAIQHGALVFSLEHR